MTTASSPPPTAYAWTAARRFVAGESLCRTVASQLSFAALRRTPPIWREARMIRERVRLGRNPIGAGVGFPSGEGRPVFLIPGYLAGDGSLTPLAVALRAAGFRPETAGIRLNIGCASAMIGLIETRLAAHVAANGGQKAIVIGQSRGGSFGRLLAARRPDLVASLITLGTPLLDPLAVNLLVLLNIGAVGALGDFGFPGVLSTRCMRAGACCDDFWRDSMGKLPEAMPFLSVYSRSDGIVDWRACLDPAARHAVVDSSHCGMAFNVEVFRAIGIELERRAT